MVEIVLECVLKNDFKTYYVKNGPYFLVYLQKGDDVCEIEHKCLLWPLNYTCLNIECTTFLLKKKYVLDPV